jgi:ABC-type antimicrobial peptide transport system permease subunit
MPLKNYSKAQPPRWATVLLRYLCAPHLLEEIEGDLEEEFDYQIEQVGVRRARLGYIRNVFGFMKPFAVKRKSTSSLNLFSMKMYKHYLTVATRNIARQKAFSFINITGLALGMTCCLFIYMWIHDERSVDNFHANGNKLYNVYETITTNNVTTGDYITTVQFHQDNRYTLPIADVQRAVPEVEEINFYASGYELPWGYPETFQVDDKKYKFEGSRASEDFFTMFSYEVIAGSREKVLKDLSSLAISRKMAEMFFDTPENAVGKSIRYENKIDFVVTAVFENVPVQSSLKFDFLINWESHMTRMEWASGNFLTTLQISENADLKKVEEKMNRFFKPYLDKNDPRKIRLGLQPFRDRYLVSNFVNGKPESGRITYVRIFSGVAVFILLIACINFMNLATARSVKRSKEIGVRKVVGSSRSSLIGQFLGESIVLSFLALVVSLALVHLLLPSFNTFTGKHIASPLKEPASFILLPALMIITGFIAGSYPALFLSSLKPARILKGSIRFSLGAIRLRKGLAVFQFAISIILLIVTIVISRQTSYVQNTHLGYDRENLIYMRIEGELMSQRDTVKNYRMFTAFKEQALKMPGIAMIDRSSEAPHAMSFVVDQNDGTGETVGGRDAIRWEGKVKRSSAGFKPMSVGFDFLKIMDLKVVEGRGFSKEFMTDSIDAFMVNEEAVKEMGIKDPIGKWVSAWKKKGKIIGVLKNYHTHSLHEPIKPLIIDVKEYEYFGVMLVRTEPGKTKEALASLEKVYKDINPNYPFGYQFMDQEYDKLYRNEQVVAKLSNAFAILAIMISCLGLLGLVMLSAEQRTKEFGIRKVLGATVTNIINLLSQDFLKLIVIAFCIAAPLAGYFMNVWLQGFAFRIPLSWWIFAVSGGVALMIAMITISVQAVQSAVTNPVKSLRSE